MQRTDVAWILGPILTGLFDKLRLLHPRLLSHRSTSTSKRHGGCCHRPYTPRTGPRAPSEAACPAARPAPTTRFRSSGRPCRATGRRRRRGLSRRTQVGQSWPKLPLGLVLDFLVAAAASRHPRCIDRMALGTLPALWLAHLSLSASALRRSTSSNRSSVHLLAAPKK